MNLYNITKDYLELYEEIMNNDGEITEEISLSLSELDKDFNNTAEYCVKMINQSQDDILVLENREKEIKNKKETKKKAVDRLKNFLKTNLELRNIEKIENPLFKISFRPSYVLNITDDTLIPNQYKSIIETLKIDKNSIKRDMKNSSSQIPGCELETISNIQIK